MAICINYTDAKGKKTTRVVDVKTLVQGNDGIVYIKAFCQSANGMRTFRSDRISGNITDVDTGETWGTVQKFISEHASAISPAKIENKNLATCRSCGEKISIHAIKCPHCGDPGGNNILNPSEPLKPRQRTRLGCLGSMITIFLVLFFIGWCSTPFTKEHNRQQPQSQPKGYPEKTTKKTQPFGGNYYKITTKDGESFISPKVIKVDGDKIYYETVDGYQGFVRKDQVLNIEKTGDPVGY